MNRLHETKLQRPQDTSKETRLPGHERDANGSHSEAHMPSPWLAHLGTGTGTVPSGCPERGHKNHRLKCMCPLQLLPTLRVQGHATPRAFCCRAAHTGKVCRKSFPSPCLLVGAEPKARKPAGSHGRAQHFVQERRKPTQVE